MGALIKKIGMGGPRSTYGNRRRAYRVLVGNPDGQGLLGRP